MTAATNLTGMHATSQELRALEELLLRSDVRRSVEELDRLLAPEFQEFGSSGRVFDKPAIIAALADEQTEFRYSMEDFKIALLASAVVLATYRLVDNRAADAPKRTLRSSIWVRGENGWRIVFHQGTRSSVVE